MSIQQYDYDTIHASPLKYRHDTFVTYADHVAAVQGSQAWHYKRGAEDERARIRAAVQAYLLDRWGPTDSNRPTDEWCRGLTSELLAIIDGEDTA